jgi:hypothetical protein
MSNSQEPVNKTSEEVDIGQLFKLIGGAFDRLFKSTAVGFRNIFNAFILLLLFIRKKIVVFAVALIVGFGAGFYLEFIEGPRYESTMMLEPNFNSVQQLYNNVEFYNELAESEETTALALALGISGEDATAIKKVKVESFADDNQKIKLFDEFIRQLDTNTIKTIDFESYMENFNSLDARFHKITMITSKSDVAKKTQEAIVNSIKINNYFKLQKEVSDLNIAIQDSLYRKQLAEIDSLQNLYKKVLLTTAENPGTGTHINLADDGESVNKELQLIKERNLLKTELVELYEEKATKASIINVISDFPERGVEINSFLESKKFLGSIAGFLLAFLALGLIQLNKYLKNYSAKLG